MHFTICIALHSAVLASPKELTNTTHQLFQHLPWRPSCFTCKNLKVLLSRFITLRDFINKSLFLSVGRRPLFWDVPRQTFLDLKVSEEDFTHPFNYEEMWNSVVQKTHLQSFPKGILLGDFVKPRSDDKIFIHSQVTEKSNRSPFLETSHIVEIFTVRIIKYSEMTTFLEVWLSL